MLRVRVVRAGDRVENAQSALLAGEGLLVAQLRIHRSRRVNVEVIKGSNPRGPP